MTTPTTKDTAGPTTIQRQRIIYVRPFDGEIQPGDLQLITDDLCTDLADNEILCEALYIGIDAGLKSQVLHYPDGITMIGGQIARIAASRNARFPVGAHIYGKFGWQTHTVTNPEDGRDGGGGGGGGLATPYVLSDFGEVGGPSLALGCLGVTGNAALVGLHEILRPERGSTLLVTAAAGGVGNLVGQLAKTVYGCKVIGITGSAEKCKWLQDQLHFDAAVCWRSATFAQDLRAATPDGVDAFFDSVGGSVHGAVVQRMNEMGRIAVNGSLATANEKGLAPPQTSYDVHRHFVAQQLTMAGFSVWHHTDQWMARSEQIAGLLRSGSVRNYETIVEGFEKCPDVLKALLRGEYRGRVVVKV